MQAVTKASEYIPDAEKVIPDLVKVLPASALDDLADSVKNGDKITKSDYQKLSKKARIIKLKVQRKLLNKSTYSRKSSEIEALYNLLCNE